MKKIVIPAILAATVLVAGMFAFMPIEKASTVHTTILAGVGGNLVALTGTITPFTAATDTATWTVGVPFCLVSLTGGAAAATDATLDLAVWAVSTNLVPAAALGLAINDGAGAASNAAHDILQQEGAGIGSNSKICGTTTLVVGNTAAAGLAGANILVTAIIETRGSVTASAAVLS